MTHVLLWPVGSVGYMGNEGEGPKIPVIRVPGGVLVFAAQEELVGREAPATPVTGADAETLVAKFREATKCL